MKHKHLTDNDGEGPITTTVMDITTDKETGIIKLMIPINISNSLNFLCAQLPLLL